MSLSTIFQIHIVVVDFIGGGNQSTWRKPSTCRKSDTGKRYHIMFYRVHRAALELTNLVVIGTDCIGSNKSNYHTITTAPQTIVESGFLSEKQRQSAIYIYIASSNCCLVCQFGR